MKFSTQQCYDSQIKKSLIPSNKESFQAVFRGWYSNLAELSSMYICKLV